MKKNLWLLGLLVFIFASCDTPAGSETGSPNTWSSVTSLDQVDGTWVSTQSLSMPLIEALGMLALFGIDMSDIFDDPAMIAIIIEQFSGMDVYITAQTTATITIDANAQTISSASNTTLIFSGQDVAAAWVMITAMYAASENVPPGVEFDDDNYSITMDEAYPPEPITADNLIGFQIDQNGTKLQAPTEYTGGFRDIIFTRVN